MSSGMVMHAGPKPLQYEVINLRQYAIERRRQLNGNTQKSPTRSTQLSSTAAVEVSVTTSQVDAVDNSSGISIGGGTLRVTPGAGPKHVDAGGSVVCADAEAADTSSSDNPDGMTSVSSSDHAEYYYDTEETILAKKEMLASRNREIAMERFQIALRKRNALEEYKRVTKVLERAQKQYNRLRAKAVQPPPMHSQKKLFVRKPEHTMEQTPKPGKEHVIEDLYGYSDDMGIRFPPRSTRSDSPQTLDDFDFESLLRPDSFIEEYFKRKKNTSIGSSAERSSISVGPSQTARDVQGVKRLPDGMDVATQVSPEVRNKSVQVQLKTSEDDKGAFKISPRHLPQIKDTKTVHGEENGYMSQSASIIHDYFAAKGAGSLTESSDSTPYNKLRQITDQQLRAADMVLESTLDTKPYARPAQNRHHHALRRPHGAYTAPPQHQQDFVLPIPPSQYAVALAEPCRERPSSVYDELISDKLHLKHTTSISQKEMADLLRKYKELGFDISKLVSYTENIFNSSTRVNTSDTGESEESDLSVPENLLSDDFIKSLSQSEEDLNKRTETLVSQIPSTEFMTDSDTSRHDMQSMKSKASYFYHDLSTIVEVDSFLDNSKATTVADNSLEESNLSRRQDNAADKLDGNLPLDIMSNNSFSCSSPLSQGEIDSVQTLRAPGRKDLNHSESSRSVLDNESSSSSYGISLQTSEALERKAPATSKLCNNILIQAADSMLNSPSMKSAFHLSTPVSDSSESQKSTSLYSPLVFHKGYSTSGTISSDSISISSSDRPASETTVRQIIPLDSVSESSFHPLVPSFSPIVVASDPQYLVSGSVFDRSRSVGSLLSDFHPLTAASISSGLKSVIDPLKSASDSSLNSKVYPAPPASDSSVVTYPFQTTEPIKLAHPSDKSPVSSVTPTVYTPKYMSAFKSFVGHDSEHDFQPLTLISDSSSFSSFKALSNKSDSTVLHNFAQEGMHTDLDEPQSKVSIARENVKRDVALQSLRKMMTIPSSSSEDGSRASSCDLDQQITNLKSQKQGIKGSLPQKPGFTSSSEENLSQLFTGSRVFFQSTPVKHKSNRFKDKGNLDDPDSTLVGESSFADSEGADSVDGRKRAKSLHGIEPTTSFRSTESPSPTGLSKSMISFLQHEKSSNEAEEGSFKCLTEITGSDMTNPGTSTSENNDGHT